MIYIVEDDKEILEMEMFALRNANFEVLGFSSGVALDKALAIEIPELFVLDIMLPGEDGLSILRRIRKNDALKQIPVIMITAKSTELDKVRGLDSGADDYLTKPFGVLEFISRVKALLRRNKTENETRIFQIGAVKLDDKKHAVFVNEESIDLTFKEYELLKLLMQNAGEVVNRNKILTHVWGVSFDMETRTVDMHVKTLRQKLQEEGARIITIRNVGYKMEVL